jgi:hypothetical protein
VQIFNVVTICSGASKKKSNLSMTSAASNSCQTAKNRLEYKLSIEDSTFRLPKYRSGSTVFPKIYNSLFSRPITATITTTATATATATATTVKNTATTTATTVKNQSIYS